MASVAAVYDTHSDLVTCFRVVEAATSTAAGVTLQRYVDTCRAMCIAPDKHILSILESETPHATWDLSRTLVSPHGLIAVLLAWRHYPELEHVRLGPQQLDASAVSLLCDTLQHCPRLKTVDVEGNPLGSLAAMSLYRLARVNRSVTSIPMGNVEIVPSLRRKLERALRQNAGLH